MIAAMRRAAHAMLLAAAGFALTAGLGACEPGEPLGWLGWRTIREVPAETALAWFAHREAIFVQPDFPGERLAPLPEAELLDPAAPLPEALAARAAAGAWLLVVSPRPDEALRLAARLSREGFPRVAVVRAEGEALATLRTAVRRDGAAQRPEAGGHRRP
jgi:hypothetical protein